MTHKKSAIIGVWLLIGATTALTLKGVFAKLAYQEGASIDAVLLMRFSLNVPIIWGFFFIYYRHNLPKISRSDFLLIALLTFLSNYIAAKADFHAIELIGVGLSRLLLNIFPVFVLVLNALYQRKMPSLSRIILTLIVQIGLFLTISGGDLAVFQGNLWGAMFSIASAFSFACYLVLIGIKGKHISSQTIITYMMTFASLYMLFDFGFSNDIQELQLSAPAWGWIIALAIFSTSIPLLMVIEAVKRIGSNDVALISSFSAVASLIISFILFNEHYNIYQLIGAAIIIICIYLLSKNSQRDSI